ncbi:MAG: YdcF family protein [Bacilli bacterium]|nr:YdcF family protein [Bacilli bacterium]
MSKKIAIILGNRVNDDGTITKIQEQRLEMALEIEKEFQPDYFILSGGSPNKKAGISEALGMYNYLIEKGFNKDKLILEDQSYSTKQNAEFSIPIAEKLGADIVIVCSSLYHFEDLQYHALEHFINEVKKTKMTLMIYTK